MSIKSRLCALEEDYADRTVPPVLMRYPDGSERIIDALDVGSVLTAPRGTTFSSPDGKLSAWCATLAAIAAGNSEA